MITGLRCRQRQQKIPVSSKDTGIFVGAFSLNKPLVLPGVDKKALANKKSLQVSELMVCRHINRLQEGFIWDKYSTTILHYAG